MYRSDDPELDFLRYDMEEQEWLKSRPKCRVCGEHIQDEKAYFINGWWICDICIEHYRKVVE